MEATIQEAVQKKYGEAARRPDSNLCCPAGYNYKELQGFIPEEVLNISYGCGTPAGLDHVKAGQTVLDIGSGGGIDCFEAARRVGPAGRVIGIDMTDEMLEIARRNAPVVCGNLGYQRVNVEFRKGYAEAMPAEDDSVDLVISNCVINLSPDKKKVFREMYRVLKPQGRFTISDIVADQPVPNYLIHDTEKWGQCLSGSIPLSEYLSGLRKAGFAGIHQVKAWPWKWIDGITFFSITITGYKFDGGFGACEPLYESRTVDGPFSGASGGEARFGCFLGPFSCVILETGSDWRRGKCEPVSERDLELISATPLKNHFVFSGRAQDLAPGDKRLTSVLPENKPCVWEGDYALLSSFFLKAQDDDGHVYESGEPLEICSKTKKVLESQAYSGFFSILRRSSRPVEGVEVACAPASGGCC